MWKYFSANNTTRYFDILPALLARYNHSVHRSIGMTPHDASQKENEDDVRIKLQGQTRASKAKFRIGVQVRIAKSKRHFEKGYTPNWTEEVFVVIRFKALTQLCEDTRFKTGPTSPSLRSGLPTAVNAEN